MLRSTNRAPMNRRRPADELVRSTFQRMCSHESPLDGGEIEVKYVGSSLWAIAGSYSSRSVDGCARPHGIDLTGGMGFPLLGHAFRKFVNNGCGILLVCSNHSLLPFVWLSSIPAFQRFQTTEIQPRMAAAGQEPIFTR